MHQRHSMHGDRTLTQWFERARFEYHAGNAPAFRVLLRRLGGRSAYSAHADSHPPNRHAPGP